MDKCGLCQQINKRITNVYNNSKKSLAHMLLNLKGFETSLDGNGFLVACDDCNCGLENLLKLWETIPDAERKSSENSEQHEYFGEQMLDVSHDIELNSVSNSKSSTIVTIQEPFVRKPTGKMIRNYSKGKKLQRKRKRTTEKSIFTSTIIEPLQKRKRVPPKRYEDYSLNKIKSNNTATRIENGRNIINGTSLESFSQVAKLRSTDGHDIGKLVEAKNDGISSGMRIVCQICCKAFRIERDFQTHFKTHTENQFETGEDVVKRYLYFCIKCDKSFPEHSAVKRHFKYAHSNERPLKCQHCEATFKHGFNLNYHMAKHEPKKRFECAFCKKKFLMRYELRIHVRTHTKEKPYKCEVCSLAFSHQSNLKAHQRKGTHKRNVNQTICEDSKIIKENTVRENKYKGYVFKPPEILIEKEVEMQPYLNDAEAEEVNKSDPLSNLEDFVTDSGNNRTEINSLETENSSEINKSALSSPYEDSIRDSGNEEINSLTTKNSPEVTTTTEPKLISTNDNKSLNILGAHESFNNSLKTGTIKLDSTLLKSLSSPTLLGLKKWPRSFQGTCNAIGWAGPSTLSDTENLNLVKFEANTSDNSKSDRNYSSCGKAIANYSQYSGAGNIPDNSKSIIIYKPSQRRFSEKTELPLAQNENSSYNNLNSTQPNSSVINLKTANTEISSGVKPATAGCKYISISKVQKSPIRLVHIQNKSHPTENSLSVVSNNELLKTNNNSKSWNIVVAARPVKIKSIINIKSSANSSISNINVFPKIADKNSTENCSISEEIVPTVSQQTTINCLRNTPATCSNSKYINISQQSLLKPKAKPPVSLTNTTNKSEITLPEKPVITKLEILPPLKPVNIPQNLIKPPTEYKYQCPYCYKYFKQKSPLNKHMRTHTNEKPYKCNLCPKSYADASNYNRHKMLHKNSAEALNLYRTPSNPVLNSPAYSTVSDPDPDGFEIMQSIKKFEDDLDDDDDASLSSSTLETSMWHDVLENALKNTEIRENIKRNLQGINNAFLPTYIKQITNTTDVNTSFSAENPD